MTIIVQSRRRSIEKLHQEFPSATVIDVTSCGEEPWVKFSPFYPHGGIPVPFSPGYTSQTVEGIWQGLKVFESEDINFGTMQITNMKNLKRTVRKYGKCWGHRAGIQGEQLLSYLAARILIYLPTYRWVLENRLRELVAQLKQLAQTETVVLLDYETNADVENLKKPLSHAQLVKLYIEGNYLEAAIGCELWELLEKGRYVSLKSHISNFEVIPTK
ncbi:MAG: hypothetical protein KME17_27170 [Cyanosarcina radialis HA8281-LM2]|jgi:hypothetical protein|nr:hypothetical protein [Cyanosarcina radialis HA8281-LM2]